MLTYILQKLPQLCGDNVSNIKLMANDVMGNISSCSKNVKTRFYDQIFWLTLQSGSEFESLEDGIIYMEEEKWNTTCRQVSLLNMKENHRSDWRN